MRLFRRLAYAVLAIICGTTSPLGADRGPLTFGADTVVVFETAKGNIEIEVDAAHAPLSAANFLKYAVRRLKRDIMAARNRLDAMRWNP